jgi:DNA invertase Pin-like site-specific DNA recombinase
MTSAAIYARVSSARQKKDDTIASQTAALRVHAEQLGVELCQAWVFEDEGHSGATLVRPGLERLRDLVAGVGVDVVLCFSPDRLARKFAYQALLIEEFTRAGTRVEFIKGPRGESAEDQLLVQFQGMFAEYEKAQIMERYRRGKAHRARAGSVNVLSGAPFGYRYVRKNQHTGARYELVEHEAVLVIELFRRYADGGASIAELARWLSGSGVATRTGKARWDRSVVWGMLGNPAYAGRAIFGKTMVVHDSPGLNRRARLEGRATPRATKTVDRPVQEWTEIPVPAIVTTETFERVAQRLADNKRFASRNSKVPSLLQGLAACSGCGYGYYRTSTRTTNKKIFYYRCLGSDDYRYEGGRVCANKPVRADYLDAVVWEHITGLLADPHLLRAEINKRLDQARTADPAVTQRQRLELALAKATKAITNMIEAFQEQLLTIDELRGRMPDLRARETSLRGQIEALDAQLADRELYLKLADNLDRFLAQLRDKADVSSVEERQRVLRLVVKDILIGPDKITIRHRIPVRDDANAGHSDSEAEPAAEGDHSPSYPLRWGRGRRALWGARTRLGGHPTLQHPGPQPGPDKLEQPPVTDPPGDLRRQSLVIDGAEAVTDVGVQHPFAATVSLDPHGVTRLMGRALRAEPVAGRQEVGLEHRLEDQLRCRHRYPVAHGRDAERPGLARLARLGNVDPPQRRRPVGPGPKRCREVLEEGCHPGRLDLLDGHAIDAGCPSVGTNVVPGPFEDIAAGDLVEQGMEPAVGLLLGAAVQHALQGTDLVQAVGLAVDLALKRARTDPSSSTMRR